MAKKPELLAPVNTNTLQYAVNSGADAVYFAVENFGARKNAANFTLETLGDAVKYCHLRGVKVHLTMNTLVKEHELELFEKTAINAAKCGVDAFIVQDLGGAEIIKSVAPGIDIHASTQLTVHSSGDAEAMKNLGFSRVVLSREMSEADILKTVNAGYTETEIFVHGALCVSYSGQCLMSSFIGGRSGNRGLCAQPCRLPYELAVNGRILKKGYLLSLKDLCLGDKMQKICEMGIDCVKVEGRMKGGDYVASVIAVYRKLIDEMRNASKDEIYFMQNAFSRDSFTKGYFAGEKFSDMVCLHGNDDIYKKRSQADEDRLTGYTENVLKNEKKIYIDARFEAHEGCPAVMTVFCDGITETAMGEVVQTAQNRPTLAEDIRKNAIKTGGTVFEIKSLDIDSGGNIFLPASAINALRRNVLEKLENAILARDNAVTGTFEKKTYKKEKTEHFYCASVRNADQLAAIENEDFKYIFVPAGLFEKVIHKPNFVYSFPDITEEKNTDKYVVILEKIAKIPSAMVKCGNFSLIKKAVGMGIKTVASPSMNVYNSVTAEVLKNLGVKTLFLSPELDLHEISRASQTDAETIISVYGKTTLMKTKFCALSASNGKCDKNLCSGKMTLTDRKNMEFPVLKTDCISEILNANPVYMADKTADLQKLPTDGFCFDFTVETPQKCEDIILKYKNGIPTDEAFTRGHFYKGVK